MLCISDPKIRRLPIKALVAGEYYSNGQYYKDLIHKLRLADKMVMRTVNIPNDEVRYYFCASDLVVLPYKSATQSGIALMACHFDKSMLATNVGALGEIIEHEQNGNVVDPDSITDAILNFFKNNMEALSNRLPL
jgi:glycosyltransferase involved in cell wall biosynthesis